MTNTPPPLLTDPAQLEQACARWREAPWLALDTEFLREDTYYPKLCLVQVGDGRDNVCIDALALGAAGLHPLFDLLKAGGTAKVFHAASQDLEIFVQMEGSTPRPLFDTQIAAALLGYGDQLGYAALVEKLLGVKLDKSLTRTDWSRRPLNAAELAYAAYDVLYLGEIHPRLRQELETRGRLAWLEEDCARLGDPARYRNPPDAAWRRLKGLARLAPPAQRAAAALAAWREQVAQERNRPRKWIIDDDAVYRLAERRPLDLAELEGLRVLPPKTLERHGEALLEVLEQAGDGAPLALEDAPLDEAQKARLKKLLDRLRALGESLGVPPTLLAPRSDVEAVLRLGTAAEVPLLRGWRREAAGEEILRLL
ncbi:MAG TPA: ribonuclease D [Nevskia sp.]|nr:ribonuclease D [Nevskia sp.]